MERWSDRVAVVTGAGSGIGAAIALDLVKAGVRVIGLGRRVERIDALKQQLPVSHQSNLHSFECDVTSETDIRAAFAWVETKFGGVDILVNNAGVNLAMNLVDAHNSDKLRSVVDTNIVGPVLCTREAFHSMKKRNFDGHVIIINSIVGHFVPFLPNGQSPNMYPSSKYAVTAMTEVLRQEFQLMETKIKITVIEPLTIFQKVLEYYI